MYVSLTNSYGMSAYGGFRQGDVFFGSAYGSNDYAIDISTGQLRSVSAWSYIQNVGGSYYSNVTIRNRVGAHEVVAGSALRSANQVLTYWAGLEYNPLYSSGPLMPDGTSGDT